MRVAWQSESKYRNRREPAVRSLPFAGQSSFGEIVLKMFDAPQRHNAFSFGGAFAEGVAGLVLDIRVKSGLSTGFFESTEPIAGLVLLDVRGRICVCGSGHGGVSG